MKQLLFSLLALTTLSGYAAPERVDFGVNAMLTPGGGVYVIQSESYKHRYDNVSYLSRFGNLQYQHSAAGQGEQGAAFLTGVGMRLYSESVKQGMYAGVSVDYIFGKLNHSGGDNNDHLNGLAPSIEMGYSFNLGKFKIEPNTMITALSPLGRVESKWLSAVGVSVWHGF